MDVRGVLRRARLSLVASLFLTALLGGPVAAATVAEPLAAPTSATAVAPAAGTVAVGPSADLTAAAPVHDLQVAAPAPGTPVDLAVAAMVLAPLAVRTRSTRLTSQIRAAVADPRAPPTAA